MHTYSCARVFLQKIYKAKIREIMIDYFDVLRNNVKFLVSGQFYYRFHIFMDINSNAF